MVFVQIALKQLLIGLIFNVVAVSSQLPCQVSGLEAPVKFSFEDCSSSENGWNHNCRLTLSCEPGSMPIFPIPILDYTGVQTLICINGTWMTTYDIAATPLKCAMGCIPRNFSTQIVNDRQIFTYYDIETQKNYNAVCQSSVLTTREEIETNNPGIIPYYCPLTDIDVDTSGCENMCIMTYRIPNQNKILKPFVEVNEDMFMFTFGDMEMIVGCQEGFEYERTSVYSANAQQVIVCDGSTGKLIDNYTRADAQILPCVEKPTCPDFPQNSNVGMVVENSLCNSKDGQLADGCVRAYYCNEGSYPLDLDYLYNGTQRVRCHNSQWLDQQNRTITASLECIYGCVEMNYTSIISYLTLHEHLITYDQFEVDGLKFQCLTDESRDIISRFIQNIRDHNNPYFCKDSNNNNNTYVVVESICQNVCPFINTTFLPEGLVATNRPSVLNVLGSPHVAVTTSYDFRCGEGYRYMEAAVRNIGMQRFTCLENGNYLDSIRNNSYGSKNILVYLCEKVPSCSLDHISSNQGIVLYNSTCSVDQIPGCRVNIACANGYYPSLQKYQSVRSIQQECRSTSQGSDFTIYQWFDVATGITTDDFRCDLGCIPLHNVNRTFSQNGFEIVCSFPLSEPSSPHYCNSSSNQTNETTCTHTCLPLQGAGSLTKTNLYVSLIIDRFVVQGDGFRFTCPIGTVFRETRTNSREFRCSGNQKYIDTNTNTSVDFVHDTCMNPENSCSSVMPPNDVYTTRNFSCIRDVNNNFAPGCRIEAFCVEGSSFTSSFVETRRVYVCESTGFYRNIETNTIMELVNDVCRVHNSTSSIVSSTTIASTTTIATNSTLPSNYTTDSSTSSFTTTSTAGFTTSIFTSTTSKRKRSINFSYVLTVKNVFCFMFHVMCSNKLE